MTSPISQLTHKTNLRFTLEISRNNKKAAGQTEEHTGAETDHMYLNQLSAWFEQVYRAHVCLLVQMRQMTECKVMSAAKQSDE